MGYAIVGMLIGLGIYLLGRQMPFIIHVILWVIGVGILLYSFLALLLH